MAITTVCAGCGKTLAVADEYAGRQARCPECKHVYTVPMTSDVVPSSGRTPGALDATTPYDPYSNGSTPALSPLSLDSGVAPQSPAAIPGPGGPLPSSTPGSSLGGDSSSSSDQYWMRASNGAEYGPADSATLARWFNEGRVGQDYLIRQGEYGPWQPSSYFQPAGHAATGTMTGAAAGANPYAAPAFGTGPVVHRPYAKSDQSGLVLAMGILSWLGMCPIFGIIAWVVGAQALADIQSGNSDPSTRGLVQLGYYLGMINVVLWVACGGLMFLGIALAAMA